MSDTQTPAEQSPKRNDKKPRGRWRRRLAIGLLVLVAIGAVLWLIPFDLKVEAYGTILSREDAVLRASVKGPVAQILKKTGAMVYKDQVILKLEDSEQKASVAKIAHQLAEARAELEMLRSSHVVQRAEQQAAIEIVQAELDAANDALVSIAKLTRSGVASELEKRETKLGVELAKARLKSASIDRSALQADQVKVQNRRIETLEADLELRREQLSNRSVVSPIDGRLVLNEISPGQVVDASTAVGQVFSVGPCVVVARLPESHQWFLRPGLKVEVEPSAYPESHFGYLTGVVGRISDVVIPRASGDGTVSLTVVLDELHRDDIVLRPGMTCRIWIRAGRTRLLWRIAPVRVFELLDEN